MIKILFVCHGNICRSTMAEFLFRNMVENKGMGNEWYTGDFEATYGDVVEGCEGLLKFLNM